MESARTASRGALFDESYYRTGCGAPYLRNTHWLSFFGNIADQLIRSLRPRRVLDAGCAMGMLVESFWDRGVEAYGVDISSYAIAQVRPDMRSYCRVASLTESLEEKFDLITCIEVVEHMPEEEAQLAILNLTRAADSILFSSTPSDFNEPTHINVHPTLYWLQLFARQGFWPELTFDAGFVAPHTVLVSRRDAPVCRDDEILAACSESLRLRAAVVDRDQRLAGIGAELAGRDTRLADMAARLAAAEQHSAGVGDELAVVGAELEKQAASLAAERRSLEQARSTEQRSLARIQELTSSLSSEEAGRRAAEAQFRQEQLRLQENRDRAHADLREAAAHRQDLEARLADSRIALRQALADRDTLAYTRRALSAIVSSPGWQAVLKYRRWLWTAYPGSRLIRQWYEPSARSLVQKLFPPRPDAPELPALAGLSSLPPGSFAAGGGLSYPDWIRAVEPGPRELALQARIAAELPYRPKISILAPVYKVPLDTLREMVASVLHQTYPDWELCIAHGDPEDAQARRYLAAAAAEDARIRVEFLQSNAGISGNSNRALELCSGEFVALLDHDDTLAPCALFEIARRLNEDPGLRFLYSDRDQLSEDGRRVDPLFKPRWSPDIMLSANYLTHLCVARAADVREVGGWRSETDGAQDWDLFLRIAERTSRVAHIPKILYHWRRSRSSVALRGLDAKPFAAQAQVRTVQDHLDRRGLNAQVFCPQPGLLRLRWRCERPSVSVIGIVNGIEDASSPEFPQPGENGPLELRIVSGAGEPPSPDHLSLPERLNLAAGQCSGEVLVFMDSAVRPACDDWLDELAFPLLDSGVGIVGAKLIDARSSLIRHAGIAFNLEGAVEYPFAGDHELVWSEFGGANWYRDWLAVSGACFAVRRDVFLRAGGFSRQPRYPRLDIDLCLNVGLHFNLRIQYNPFARLSQLRPSLLEQCVDGNYTAGAAFIRALFPEGDPCFSRNITCAQGSVSLRLPQPDVPWQNRELAGEDRSVVAALEHTPAEIEASLRSGASRHASRTHRLTWFLPPLERLSHGGIHTILRFADHILRAHGMGSEFVVSGPHSAADRVSARLAAVSPGLAQSSRVVALAGRDSPEAVGPSDASLAAHWTTACSLLRFNRTGAKFYFMQDDGPSSCLSAPVRAMAESTCRLGFYGICGTPALRDWYVLQGGQAESFEPCIDRNIFFSRLDERPADPYVLFWVARPGEPRDAVEFVAEVLRRLKKRMGDQVALVAAGDSWRPAQFGLEGVVHNLGALPYGATGAAYRMAHAGLALMMTPHPSYLPLELMASGSLVIANRNEHTGWLLRDGETCLLAETNPGAIAGAAEQGLRDHALRARIVRNAAEMVERSYQAWDEQAEKVYQYIEGKL